MSKLTCNGILSCDKKCSELIKKEFKKISLTEDIEIINPSNITLTKLIKITKSFLLL